MANNNNIGAQSKIDDLIAVNDLMEIMPLELRDMSGAENFFLRMHKMRERVNEGYLDKLGFKNDTPAQQRDRNYAMEFLKGVKPDYWDWNAMETAHGRNMVGRVIEQREGHKGEGDIYNGGQYHARPWTEISSEDISPEELSKLTSRRSGKISQGKKGESQYRASLEFNPIKYLSGQAPSYQDINPIEGTQKESGVMALLQRLLPGGKTGYR